MAAPFRRVGGESQSGALRLDFDRRIKLHFHGAKLSSDAGHQVSNAPADCYTISRFPLADLGGFLQLLLLRLTVSAQAAVRLCW